MKIGTQLRDARIEADYSQDEVSGELHISRQAISRWENDRGYPDLDNLIRLCSLYNKPIEFFFSIDPNLRQHVKDKSLKAEHQDKVLNSVDGQVKKLSSEIQNLKQKHVVIKQRNQKLELSEACTTRLLFATILTVYASLAIPVIGCVLPLSLLFFSKGAPEHRLLYCTIIVIILISTVDCLQLKLF